MEIITTKILITVAVILGLYAILQTRIRKKKLTDNKISQEYLKILNSEEYKVK